MKHEIVLGLIMAHLLCLLTSAQTPQEPIPPGSGAIEGRVVDAEGNPVPKAEVYALPDRPMGGIVPSTYTDGRGRFFLSGLIPGSYSVYAVKEDEGYPNVSAAFYPSTPEALKKVIVYEQQVTKGIVLRLGPKAARLVGRTVEAESGQPVVHRQMIFCHRDNPRNCYSTNATKAGGQFNFLIPSVPITMRVSARGYEDWYYRKDGSKDQGDSIWLAPNETKELLISLHPTRKPQH